MQIYQEINDKIPVIDYLNDIGYINLTDNQLPISISCPLHKDNKPSMRLYKPKSRGAYCFSCGKAFNSLSLHIEMNSCSFYEALEFFSENYGVNIDKEEEIESISEDKNMKLSKFINNVNTEIRKLPIEEQKYRLFQLEKKIYKYLRKE